MRYASIALALLFATTMRVAAKDVWVVGGFGESITGPCTRVRWTADGVLYNLAPSAAAVRIVHVSNGGTDNVSATLPTGAVSRAMILGAAANGALWVSHLNVPSSTYVEGRMEYFGENVCSGFPPDPLPQGKIATPIFSELIPAGQEQVHLGTDLGRQSARINVTVYNAGSAPALGTLVLHLPTCASSSALTREIVLPADTTAQIPLGSVRCDAGSTFPAYVTVVMDQPSLSFVSTLSNEVAPAASIDISRP